MQSGLVSNLEDPSSSLAIAYLAALSRKTKELGQLIAMPTIINTIALIPHLDNHSVLLDQEGGSFSNRRDVYPTDPVIGSIVLLSIVYNVPRFFDSTIDYREDYSLARVNDTGNPLVDQQLVKVKNEIDCLGFFTNFLVPVCANVTSKVNIISI